MEVSAAGCGGCNLSPALGRRRDAAVADGFAEQFGAEHFKLSRVVGRNASGVVNDRRVAVLLEPQAVDLSAAAGHPVGDVPLLDVVDGHRNLGAITHGHNGGTALVLRTTGVTGAIAHWSIPLVCCS